MTRSSRRLRAAGRAGRLTTAALSALGPQFLGHFGHVLAETFGEARTEEAREQALLAIPELMRQIMRAVK